jgi:hypothetical protein
MAGHNDFESENLYSDEAKFKEKESEILLGLSNGGVRFCGCGEGTVMCPFAVARKCHHGVFASCCSTGMGSLAEVRGPLGQSIVLWPSMS